MLHVSKNEGHIWNAAQLPMIGREEFYSLLDMSEDMVFVHVDTPGGNCFYSLTAYPLVILEMPSIMRLHHEMFGSVRTAAFNCI